MEIEASITKAELPVCARHYGAWNSKAFGDHAVKTLQYVTFIGVMDHQTRLLVGAHKFKAGQAPTDAATADFNKLPGLEVKK